LRRSFVASTHSAPGRITAIQKISENDFADAVEGSDFCVDSNPSGALQRITIEMTLERPMLKHLSNLIDYQGLFAFEYERLLVSGRNTEAAALRLRIVNLLADRHSAQKAVNGS
jgi:hypothetical protein